MPLNPQIEDWLSTIAALDPAPIERQTVAEARLSLRKGHEWTAGPGAEVARVEEREVPTPQGPIPVRCYWPTGGDDTEPGLLVWFHGGGFLLGDLDTADVTARDLCAGTGAIVASVDYPLAPEHPFPAAPEACHGVLRWLADHAGQLGADADRLAVGGDSAGGNLAAVTALLARDRGGPPIRFQLLVYPVVDLLGSYPSVRDNGEGYFLTRAAMEWFHGHYLPPEGADPQDPMASPIYAGDLAGLPPALVITAEFDPLRDEGEAYAERLRQAGTDAVSSRYDGMIHGFFSMTAITDRAKEAEAEAVAALRQGLAPASSSDHDRAAG